MFDPSLFPKTAIICTKTLHSILCTCSVTMIFKLLVLYEVQTTCAVQQDEKNSLSYNTSNGFCTTSTLYQTVSLHLWENVVIFVSKNSPLYVQQFKNFNFFNTPNTLHTTALYLSKCFSIMYHHYPLYIPDEETPKNISHKLWYN